MATSTLNVTTELVGNQYQITATVSPGSLLPPAIFIYQNQGTTTLGPYIGIPSVSELTRLPVFTGTALPVFGNINVLYDSLTVLLPAGSSPSAFVSNLTAAVQTLSTAYQSVKITTQQVLIQ